MYYATLYLFFIGMMPGRIGWKSIEMMPGRIGQIGHHLNGFPPNLTNSTSNSCLVELGIISMDFHPIQPVINAWLNWASSASYAWLIQPGIISMDFHPI